MIGRPPDLPTAIWRPGSVWLRDRFKRLLDRIDLIESVKFVDDLSKNRLTIPCQEIEELFILLDIVGLLLSNNDRVILISCSSVRVGHVST